jgi:ATP-dependent DNA ligase
VVPGGHNLLGETLARRRQALEAFMAAAALPKRLELSPATHDVRRAAQWLGEAGHRAPDGVVAKPVAQPYAPGEPAMVKVKQLSTADCVVGGFRYLTRSERARPDQVGSSLLGLYDGQGRLDHVGFTATITDAERPALTKRLEKLREEPGFTGKAPGGPSRWSTERSSAWQALRPELVVEVRFDHVTGARFRHGTKLLCGRTSARSSAPCSRSRRPSCRCRKAQPGSRPTRRCGCGANRARRRRPRHGWHRCPSARPGAAAFLPPRRRPRVRSAAGSCPNALGPGG